MAYKCLKCGCEETYPLKVKRFEAEATIYDDTKEVGFGTKEEEAGTIINCKKCDNFGHPSDKTKFSIIED